MARAPFQVIVLLYRDQAGQERLYAIFKRRVREMWQAVSGGGEDAETPAQAALRETREETGIDASEGLLALDSMASIPATGFPGSEHWPAHLLVIPEYAFGLPANDRSIQLSEEHSEVAWLPFREAQQRLTWDSNKVALWELEQRLNARR